MFESVPARNLRYAVVDAEGWFLVILTTYSKQVVGVWEEDDVKAMIYDNEERARFDAERVGGRIIKIELR